VPSWLVGDALALRALVDAQRAQLLEQQVSSRRSSTSSTQPSRG
jgi:hypothetical protein